MDYAGLCGELKLTTGFLSIKRLTGSGTLSCAEKGCTLALLKKAFSGETLYFTKDSVSCPGAAVGFGFSDGLPEIPGGFGYFISTGRGEGFPLGERVKCNPETGERMLLGQPQNVLEGFDCIRIKPYEPEDGADTVTALVTAEQLSVLIHLFCFRKPGYENIIAPMVSGCASVFRIPFGELKKDEPRGIIGNIDVFSRPHFPADTLFFTIPGRDFETMLTDAGDSVLASPVWKEIKNKYEVNHD